MKVATWQAKWVIATGPKVVHSSSEMKALDVEVGKFLVNLLSRVAKASSVPPPTSRESANEVYEEERRRREKGRT